MIWNKNKPNGGTVARQRNGKTLLDDDLLRGVLVAIVRDVAIVSGVTRVAVVSADVVGGLEVHTVGIRVLVKIAERITTCRRNFKC